MGKISTYAVVVPVLNDLLIGTEVPANNETKNFLVANILRLLPGVILQLPIYASNAAALLGGLSPGQLFRDASGVVRIVF
jgi:hypothetical protein